MGEWLDFNWVKDNASFEAVARHYKLALICSGSQRKARCPFHEDRRPSLQVNLDKSVFHCFGCNASGNILDFVMKSENCGIHEAATRLMEICRLEPPRGGKPAGKGQNTRKAAHNEGGDGKSGSRPKPRASEAPVRIQQGPKLEAGRKVNPPLTFRLNLDQDAALPYLECRDFDKDAAEEFGLGVALRGLMAGRLCIPIHDAHGELVAYAGRYMGAVPDDVEKYLLPPKFTKTLELFNLHRALTLAADHLIVVEGYFGAMRLHRLGYPTVAVMGSSISDEQVAAIEASGRTPFVMMDGDDQGRKAAEKIACVLVRRIATRLVDLPDGEEPDTISEEFLQENLPQPVG
jgi:DNA primase